jgi:predicted metal-dependent hydrolase
VPERELTCTARWLTLSRWHAQESDEDEQVRKTALREVRILKVRTRALICATAAVAKSLTSNAGHPQQLKHDNIVSLIEVFRRKGKLYLVRALLPPRTRCVLRTTCSLKRPAVVRTGVRVHGEHDSGRTGEAP